MSFDDFKRNSRMYDIPKPGLYKNYLHPDRDLYIYVTHINYNQNELDTMIWYYTLENPNHLIPIRSYPFNSNFLSVEAI